MTEHDRYQIQAADPGSVDRSASREEGYAPYAVDPYDTDDAGLDLRRLPAILLRYKWLVAGSLVLGVLAALLAATMSAPRYTATALIQVANPQVRETGVTAIQANQVRTPADWQNLLRSFSVLEPVALDHKLFVSVDRTEFANVIADPEVDGDIRPGTYVLEVSEEGSVFRIRDRSGGVLQETGQSAELGRPLGVLLNPRQDRLVPGIEITFRLNRIRDAARSLSDRLQIQTGPTAYMAVQYSHGSPEQAAMQLNAVLESFVREATDLTRARSDELRRTLEGQLASARRSLEEAERELEGFQSANVLRPSGVSGGDPETDGAMSRYMERRIQVEELERDRQAIQRAMQTRDDGSAVRLQTLEAIPTVQASSELSRILGDVGDLRAERRSLLLRYTEDYPPLQSLESELRTLESEVIPVAVTELLNELDARLAGLQEQVRVQESDIGSIPVRAMTEAGLRREVERVESVYQDVSARYENARLASLSETPDVQIVDWADPPTFPDADRSVLFAGVAFLGFLGAGLLGAVLLDRTDRRVRSPGDVEHQLGIPLLGVLPHMRTRRGRPHSADHDQAVEAFRSIRTGILYAYGKAGPIVLTVSSPAEGDGKSFTASNLALSFAELGRKTVLVDGDVRRGVQHELTGVERKPGLSDHLKGTHDLEEVLKSTEHPELHVIPLGSHMTNAPELLSTVLMQDLLADLKGKFDVIIIDSCPLGAAADPIIFGTLTGNLALVVRSGSTNLEHAEVMLQKLTRYPVRLLGTIVNDVSAQDDYSYYGYISGYSVPEDEAGSRRQLTAVARS
jgi:polysaccharide biosynthesis transport protein